VLERCDQALVRRPAGVRAEEHQAVPLLDDPCAVGELLAQVVTDAARDPALGVRDRRLGLQPDELRVRVLQARAGGAALVDAGEEELAVVARSLGAQAPRLGHEFELPAVELGD
jgi:hypothetical protein